MKNLVLAFQVSMINTIFAPLSKISFVMDEYSRFTNVIRCLYCLDDNLELVETTIYNIDKKKSVTLSIIKCSECSGFSCDSHS